MTRCAKESKAKSAVKKAIKAVEVSMAVVAYAGFISVLYYKALKGQFKHAKVHKNKRNN
tara:strand:+ start:3050 stop:3226 length:177 start_codon:yes stop_codon:yes gene_type:complete